MCPNRKKFVRLFTKNREHRDLNREGTQKRASFHGGQRTRNSWWPKDAKQFAAKDAKQLVAKLTATGNAPDQCRADAIKCPRRHTLLVDGIEYLSTKLSVVTAVIMYIYLSVSKASFLRLMEVDIPIKSLLLLFYGDVIDEVRSGSVTKAEDMVKHDFTGKVSAKLTEAITWVQDHTVGEHANLEELGDLAIDRILSKKKEYNQLAKELRSSEKRISSGKIVRRIFEQSDENRLRENYYDP